MAKVRNRLLVLLALLVVGVIASAGVSIASIQIDRDPTTAPSIIPTTGEPDISGTTIKPPPPPHGATQTVPGDSNIPSIPAGVWFRWAVMIWAAKMGVRL